MIRQQFRKIPLFKKLVQKYRTLKGLYKDDFNIWKTLYLNFKVFHFSVAWQLPIFVFGKLKIYNLGKIIIDCPVVFPGMIELGRNRDRFKASAGSAMIDNSGILIFKGAVRFSVDYGIYTMKSGTVEIDECTFLGHAVKLYCYHKISIGKCCRIGLETQLFDSGFHFMKNVETGEIRNIMGEVVMGDYCWIGNRTTLARGTVLPDHSIVASNSLVNKNFANLANYPLLGGIPAKPISSGTIRIFNRQDENRLFAYFLEHPDEQILEEQPGELNEFDIVKKEYYPNY